MNVDNSTLFIWSTLIVCYFFVGSVTLICLLASKTQESKAKKQTRQVLFGVWATILVISGLVLVGDQVEKLGRATTHAHAATFDTEPARSRLKKPKIDLTTLAKDLDKFAKAEPINDPPLQVTKNLPDWVGRPQSDYVTQSDFLKKLYAEQEADWIRIRRPRSTRGLDRCLAMERWVVLRDVRSYCTKRSDGRLGENAELGMTDEEIYRRFVKHRYLVEENGEHTIYTMTVIKNGEGGDELLNKTLAKAKKNVLLQVVEEGPLRVVEEKGKTIIKAPAEAPTSGVMALLDKLRSDQAKMQTADAAPDWVTTPPKRVGEVFRQVLKSGPYATVEECYRDADARLNAVARRYASGVELHLGEGSSVDTPVDLHAVTGDWGGPAISELRRRLARDTHLETVDASFGEMKQLYTLVEITPDDGKWLTAKWKAHKQQHRLMTVAFIAGAVLVLVAGVLALLKIDEATRGYYTKRLLIGVPAATLAVVLAALLLVA